MCAVPSMAVFCNSLTSWFPGMLLTYFLNDLLLLLLHIIVYLIKSSDHRINAILTAIFAAFCNLASSFYNTVHPFSFYFSPLYPLTSHERIYKVYVLTTRGSIE
jgi:hypothetical protein